jgi:hypothetical protein
MKITSSSRTPQVRSYDTQFWNPTPTRADLPTHDPELVAKHQDLRVLGCFPPSEQKRSSRESEERVK